MTHERPDPSLAPGFAPGTMAVGRFRPGSARAVGTVGWEARMTPLLGRAARAVLIAVLVAATAAPALAQTRPDTPPPPPPVEKKPPRPRDEPPRDPPAPDENVAKGDYYFKTGYYLPASEAYRVAVLADPTSAQKKLAFGHSLFAIGNYSYASYALRRAVATSDASQPFEPDVVALFPSRKSFDKAVRDLKRHVAYNPRDPAGLSVLGYVLYSAQEDDAAREMFQYLQKIPANANDPFARYFLKLIETRKSATPSHAPVPVDTPKVEAAPPKVAPPPPPAPKPEVKPSKPPEPATPPEAGRIEEDTPHLAPVPAPAVAE